jgi:hypothetical protein
MRIGHRLCQVKLTRSMTGLLNDRLIQIKRRR